MRKEFIVLSYDIDRYPFSKVLERQVFKVPRLDKLHLAWRKQTGRDVFYYNDNLILRKVMQDLPDEAVFYKVYHKWIADLIAPNYANKISYSKHPKMRVHLAGTGTVSDFHRDTEVTGRPDQINCYLPFTDVFDGSTIYCQTEYNSENYEPLNLKYGQALLWDGGLLKHGTYFNDTDNTRVSCDFRFSYAKPEKVRPPWNDILNHRL
ncbi:MAG: streptomycin biosynthesis enzyme StrG [Pedobacter sp.]|nr:MAG: streptomycin biosynthesis enzyme StrG [Pedobacter sp.]